MRITPRLILLKCGAYLGAATALCPFLLGFQSWLGPRRFQVVDVLLLAWAGTACLAPLLLLIGHSSHRRRLLVGVPLAGFLFCWAAGLKGFTATLWGWNLADLVAPAFLLMTAALCHGLWAEARDLKCRKAYQLRNGLLSFAALPLWLAFLATGALSSELAALTVLTGLFLASADLGLGCLSLAGHIRPWSGAEGSPTQS